MVKPLPQTVLSTGFHPTVMITGRPDPRTRQRPQCYPPSPRPLPPRIPLRTRRAPNRQLRHRFEPLPLRRLRRTARRRPRRTLIARPGRATAPLTRRAAQAPLHHLPQNAHQLRRILKHIVVHAFFRMVDVSDGGLGEPSAAVAVVEAVVEVGGVLGLDGEADRVGAGEVGVG